MFSIRQLREWYQNVLVSFPNDIKMFVLSFSTLLPPCACSFANSFQDFSAGLFFDSIWSKWNNVLKCRNVYFFRPQTYSPFLGKSSLNPALPSTKHFYRSFSGSAAKLSAIVAKLWNEHAVPAAHHAGPCDSFMKVPLPPPFSENNSFEICLLVAFKTIVSLWHAHSTIKNRKIYFYYELLQIILENYT